MCIFIICIWSLAKASLFWNSLNECVCTWTKLSELKPKTRSYMSYILHILAQTSKPLSLWPTSIKTVLRLTATSVYASWFSDSKILASCSCAGFFVLFLFECKCLIHESFFYLQSSQSKEEPRRSLSRWRQRRCI